MSNEPDSAAKVEREIQEIANRRGEERRKAITERYFETYGFWPPAELVDVAFRQQEAELRMKAQDADALQRELEAVTRQAFQAQIYNKLNYGEAFQFGSPMTFPPYPIIDTGTLLPPMPAAPVSPRRDPSKLHGVDIDLEGEAPSDGAVKPTRKVEIDL